MIDLHIHTIYSDGTSTVKEILEKAHGLGLEAISITDHNNVKSYFEIENNPELNNLFLGKIIHGCEFTTTYKKQLIEILGYNIDYKKIDTYLSKYFSLEGINHYSNTMYNRIIDKLHDAGYTCNLERVNNRAFNTEFFTSEIYEEIIKYPENIELLNKEGFTSHSNFLRKGITNPSSSIFVDTSDLKPSLEETINAIHNANGIAFLAHPFQYAVNDMETFLNELTSNYKIEGIECYHTTFNNKQSEYLLDYTKKKNLFISGGSDYHGKNKKNHHLGIGNGNLNIDKAIISNWDK